MLELLVIGMCIGDYECDQMLRAYRQTASGKIYTRNAKEIAYDVANKEALAVVGSMYAAASNRKVKLRLSKGLTLTGNVDSVNMVYKYEY